MLIKSEINLNNGVGLADNPHLVVSLSIYFHFYLFVYFLL